MKAGDILRVKPLQDVSKFTSNVAKSYDVIVLDDNEDRLITAMYKQSGHVRTFNKHSLEWAYGHKKRFEKIGEDFGYLKNLNIT